MSKALLDKEKELMVKHVAAKKAQEEEVIRAAINQSLEQQGLTIATLQQKTIHDQQTYTNDLVNMQQRFIDSVVESQEQFSKSQRNEIISLSGIISAQQKSIQELTQTVENLKISVTPPSHVTSNASTSQTTPASTRSSSISGEQKEGVDFGDYGTGAFSRRSSYNTSSTATSSTVPTEEEIRIFENLCRASQTATPITTATSTTTATPISTLRHDEHKDISLTGEHQTDQES